MTAAVSEYEFEALPELSGGYASELEGDRESEQFFGALANLARRGVGWFSTPGSPQRQAALVDGLPCQRKGSLPLGAGGERKRRLGSPGSCLSRSTNGKASWR